MKASVTLYRLAVVLAVCTLILLIVGAMTGAAGPASASRAAWLRVHRHLGEAVGFLALVTMAWLLLSDCQKWLKTVGVWALALFGAQAWLGVLTTRTPALGVAHAILSHLCFALLTLLALGVSPAWSGEAALLEDRGWPSLRSLAWITPPAVLLQTALGAAYRHNLISSVPHIGWAFVVILLILMLATFAIFALPPGPAEQRQYQGLRRGAIALMTLVLVQLILGVSAFLARMNLAASLAPDELMSALRSTHLGTGALVLGFTVALSAEILRRAAPAASASTAGAPRLAGNGHGG
jgi:heme A synthase